MSYFEDGQEEAPRGTGYYDDAPEDMYDEEQVYAEQHTQVHEQPRPVGVRLSDFRGRISRALATLERGHVAVPGLDTGEEFGDPNQVVAEVTGAEQDQGFRPEEEAPFPVSRAGYDRDAVEARITELEHEIEALRASQPQMSISEELERLGEQTASILVVAHDQAHETTRMAQEQADRCVADAAANAVAITEKAKRDLSDLDDETDAVWRERTRLLDDARAVGTALIALAAEAKQRFPEEGKTVEASRVPR